jgi:oligopeptide/dipeptide ABC transporter ATP-binding protein
MTDNNTILQVENLKVHFAGNERFGGVKKNNVIRAVDGVTFYIKKGEVLGLVGESGCGKSTISRAILQLIPSTAGKIFYKAKNLIDMTEKEMRGMRRQIQMIFQDPYASLNPSMTVNQTISEMLKIHRMGDRNERKKKVEEILEIVELDPSFIDRYPHEFSGGQRQRISIARALAVKPEFLVADEPVSALDVSVQAQIINLLQELQEKFDLTYLFISHDLSVVRHISNRIAIMYLGKIMEITDTDRLYKKPCHPYSKALLSAVPIPDPEIEMNRQRIILSGEVPDAYNIPKGCRFNTRCSERMDICFQEEPELKEIGKGHFAACYLY